jgi:hypothetical protein
MEMGSVFSYGVYLTPRCMVLTWLVWKDKSKDDGAADRRRADVFIRYQHHFALRAPFILYLPV